MPNEVKWSPKICMEHLEQRKDPDDNRKRGLSTTVEDLRDFGKRILGRKGNNGNSET